MPLFTGAAGAVRELSSTRLTENTATLSFTSIPQTCKHLQIVLLAKTTHTANENVLMRFNGDSGNNYLWQITQAANTTASGAQALLTSSIVPGSAVLSTGTSRPSPTVIDIPEYTQTNFHKVAVSVSGRSPDDSTMLSQSSFGHWKNTAAITSITFSLGTGSFATGSIATLYGLT